MHTLASRRMTAAPTSTIHARAMRGVGALRADRLGVRATAPRPSRAASTLRKWRLIAEFGLLFFAVPALFVFGPMRTWIIPSLLVGGALCLWLLLTDDTFDRRQLWNASAGRVRLRKILLRFALAAALIIPGVLLIKPELFLNFPLRNTWFWLAVMFAYPFFSVYPQELIFRCFLFHRYAPVFGSGAAMIAASALAFGFGHILFLNLFAVVMTVIGGALFARTYQKTRSTLACALEHGLYGDFIFTIGLGAYFYAGTVGS